MFTFKQHINSISGEKNTGIGLQTIVFVFAIICFLLPCSIVAQVKTNDSSFLAKKRNVEEIKVKQRGSEWAFEFPKLKFKSALKIINMNGILVKAVMIDEGLETITVPVGNIAKGIYECVFENRTQRFTKKIMVQ